MKRSQKKFVAILFAVLLAAAVLVIAIGYAGDLTGTVVKLGSLLSRAAGRGIGFSKLVSTSNEVDLDLADFVDYLVDDQATSVIALYMEGLRNVPKFRAAAQKAAKAGKPIIVFK